jgi:hypothetical protein
MLLYFILQAIAIQFAISVAKHDEPAVTKFSNSGLDHKPMARFHRYNVWLKGFFCIMAAFVYQPVFWPMLFAGFISALWIYLVFDIALNLSRRKGWDYLGEDDADGRFWNKHFGTRGGELKAIILFVAIVIVNCVYYKIIL